MAMKPPPADSLSQALRDVEAAWPFWHCFVSDEGRLWAVTAHHHYADGSGITVDAGHPSQLGQAIAEAEHQFARWAA